MTYVMRRPPPLFPQQIIIRVGPSQQRLRGRPPPRRDPEPHVERVRDAPQQHADARDHDHIRRRPHDRISRLHLVDELLEVQPAGDVVRVSVVPEHREPVRDVDVRALGLPPEPFRRVALAETRDFVDVVF
eukprot:23850-Pelagococcus_subviridis.AAC.3